MFCIVDTQNHCVPIKSGFHTASQANHWAKKNLPEGDVHLWGMKHKGWKLFRYHVRVQ